MNVGGWQKIDRVIDRVKVEQEKQSLYKRDESMLKRGYVWKVDSWIHGAGDDYRVSTYWTTEPTKKEIKKMLKEQGSEVDDYKLINLGAK